MYDIENPVIAFWLRQLKANRYNWMKRNRQKKHCRNENSFTAKMQCAIICVIIFLIFTTIGEHCKKTRLKRRIVLFSKNIHSKANQWHMSEMEDTANACNILTLKTHWCATGSLMVKQKVTIIPKDFRG